MITRIALALAASLFLSAGLARAAPDDLYLSLYADRQVPYVDPANGAAHAFMCFSTTASWARGDACFGFFPRAEAITSIALANGGGVQRTAHDWVETGTGFHFTQQPSDANQVVLFDASRKMTWTLSSPRGGSSLTVGGAAQPWGAVTGVTYNANGGSFIGGNRMPGAYQEGLFIPAATNVVFTRKISAAQRDQILSMIAAWNSQGHRLGRDDYVSALAAVAARIGVAQPLRLPLQKPADYVAGLAKLNP